VRCDELETMIAASGADLERYSKLCRLAIAESTVLTAIGRALRITNQSRMKSDVAVYRAKAGGGPRGIEALLDD